MEQDLIQRAFAAYLKTEGLGADQPTSRSSVEAVGNFKYVVLRDERRVLAVYRLHNSGLLRRKRRWPLAFNTASAAAARKTGNVALEAAHG
jgi:hypothetical protein